MCGRFAFYQSPIYVQRRLQAADMQVDSAPADNDVRLSYNFAPGYYGMVYRATRPDEAVEDDGQGNIQSRDIDSSDSATKSTPATPKYKLQAMKWGLIPSWTKRNSEYGSMLKTINCRDDSLMENRGMWTSMKHKKRCVIVCQGFYEWLKRPGSKVKIPHYVKRADGQLMLFAGLWDSVHLDGHDKPLYTFTIITTDSNLQLKFLHDRMPVLLDPGSQAIYTWLDPARTEWGPDLQRLLRPYKGDLDCYPVNHDVGKVGNNDPNFIVPLSSTQNKANIMNFFSKHTPDEKSTGIKQEVDNHSADRVQPDHRATEDVDRSEDNAPMPVSPPAPKVKREHPDDDMDLTTSKRQRSDQTSYGRPVRSGDRVDRNMRSSTHNISKKGGGANSKLSVSGKKNTKITSFFVDQAAG